MFGAGAAAGLRQPGDRSHLLHTCRGVLVHDDVHGRRERDVPADVIAVGVRVDDRRHRLAGELLDLREDRLAPARVLRVDDGDAVGLHEHGRVSAAACAAQHEEIVLELLDLDHRGTLRLATAPGRLLICGHRHRKRTNANEHSQNAASFHAMPPGKNTR
jgi:hypothetical protein